MLRLTEGLEEDPEDRLLLETDCPEDDCLDCVTVRATLLTAFDTVLAAEEILEEDRPRASDCSCRLLVFARDSVLD